MKSHLVANPAAALESFAEDFESGGLGSTSPLRYKDNAEQRTGRLAFQSDETRVGEKALQLTLGIDGEAPQPGTSQRAEIWEQRRIMVPYGIGQWYAISMKLAHPIPSDDHRHLLMQWKGDIPPHMSPKISPFLALRLREGRLYFTAETELLPEVEGSNGPPVWHRKDTAQSRIWIAGEPGTPPRRYAKFSASTDRIVVKRYGHDMPAATDRWIDWVFYTKPGPDGTGHIEIIADGKRLATVTGQIGHHNLYPGMYFKFGPYRDAREGRWDVYYDRFRRGPRLSDVWDGPVDPVFPNGSPVDV